MIFNHVKTSIFFKKNFLNVDLFEYFKAKLVKIFKGFRDLCLKLLATCTCKRYLKENRYSEFSQNIFFFITRKTSENYWKKIRRIRVMNYSYFFI